jgi:hypothetical protein
MNLLVLCLIESLCVMHVDPRSQQVVSCFADLHLVRVSDPLSLELGP